MVAGPRRVGLDGGARGQAIGGTMTLRRLIAAAMACVAMFGFSFVARAADAKLDGARIEQLTGAKGKMDEKEAVFKVSVPRGDLKVTTAGVRMTPPMGLTSWVAFVAMG